MSDALAAARISVLMPAYNAERYVLQSVQSVLGQTYEDFELLVVDDCSTDRTPVILASIQDRRLRVLRNERNLGIVGSLNRAMEHARGGYIARIDADDYCLPTRFAKQVQYLDAHPNVVLLGTETFILEDGKVRRERQRGDADPAVVRWRSLVSNPIGHPTMMFRADAAASLGTYLREEFKYAEDFDFSHRLLRVGDLAVLPENLVIYRHHRNNLTRTRRAEMVAKAAAVLAGAYAALLGQESAAEASLVAEHLMAGEPVRSVAALERLGALLDRLVTAFLAANALSEDRVARVIAHASDVWWAAVQASLRAGGRVPAALGHGRFRWSRASRPPLHRIARSAASGLVRGNLAALRRQRGPVRAGEPRAPSVAAAEGDRSEDPPRLYAVVGTAAGWSGAHTVRDQAQAIFDRFGLRPVHLLNDASPTEDDGALRGFLERHACAIGVRVPTEPDKRALNALVGAIREQYHLAPLLLTDGGRSLERHDADALDGLGFVVDLGDPAAPGPARSGLASVATLSPERATSAAMIRYVRAMARRGHRAFALHCGSPALAADQEAILQRTGAVCRFFFEEFGGLPGNPADLVPQRLRERV